MSFDLVSQNITLLMRDIKNLSPIIRKDMAAANEKDRSIGNLCEQLADGCNAASNHQRPTVQSALIGFATILCRVELSRKALYQRILPLSSNVTSETPSKPPVSPLNMHLKYHSTTK